MHIKAICLTYLSFDVFQTGKCYSNTEFEARLDQYPLYSYAAEHWGHHARIQPVIEKTLKGFLGDKGKANACVQAIFARSKFSSYGDYSNQEPRDWTGLHLAAYFGLQCVAQTMIRNCDVSNTSDSMGRAPFTWAVYEGYIEVAKLFLENGVDAKNIDFEGCTPISLAASRGWLDIVKLLLDHTVDPVSRDIDNQTPLSWAAYRGHTEVARLLLARGANSDSKDDYGKTPLSWAAADGWVEMVHILIDQDVGVNSKYGLGRTPISYAAENGHLSVIKVLLDKGARPDIEDADGNTPAVWATQYGNQAALNLLEINSINPRPSLADSEYNEQLSFDFARQNSDRKTKPAFPMFRPHTPMLTAPSAHKAGLECPLCLKGTWSSHNHRVFRRHIQDQHYPRFTYTCIESTCKSKFKRRDKAAVHIRMCHGMSTSREVLKKVGKEHDPPVNCPLCRRRTGSWNEFLECLVHHAKNPSSSNKLQEPQVANDISQTVSTTERL